MHEIEKLILQKQLRNDRRTSNEIREIRIESENKKEYE